MSPLARSLSLALLLLAVFLGVIVTLHLWSRRETARLQAETQTFRENQLRHALTLLPPPSPGAERDYLNALGRLLGGTVTRQSATTPATPAEKDSTANLNYCEATAPDGSLIRLTYPVTIGQRQVEFNHRLLLATIIVSLLLLIIPLLLHLLRQMRSEGHTAFPWERTHAEMSGLEQLAKITAERGEKLLQESDARRRAEESLQVSSKLLTRSQDERARLGRELHDNISQTLYAVCLTLESVRRKISATPEVWQRLEQSIGELRRLNREVRAYLSELDPEQIRVESFHEAVGQMLELIPDVQDLKISNLLDEEVVSQIRPQQTVEVVNILREAVSNASRHGHARRISIRAERDQDTIVLAVEDDGIGFPENPQAKPGSGHGLGNMQARAAALGGSLKIDTSTGKGTRIVLFLPVASPAP